MMLPMLGIYLAFGGLFPTCLGAGISPTVPCSSLTVTPPDGASLINATATERYNVTFEGSTYNGVAGSVNICDVEVYLTHGDAGDAVLFAIYLPLEGWNGRWQGTGGGGFVAGAFDFELVPAVTSGYSAGATDAGVGLAGNTDAWYNSTQLIENFVHLSLHEMTVLGKDLSEKFYGKKPEYSYWFGCSTGGRQGMIEAQRYPEDYDGIFAGAPAINWDKLLVADYWPLAVQNQGDEPVPLCKLSAIGNASVNACDLLDGAADGLISNPLKCQFDANSVVGMEAQCDGSITGTITEHDAAVWNKIRDGPKDQNDSFLWYGMQPGTNVQNLAIQPGFLLSKQWIGDFILQDPSLDVSDIKEDELADLFHLSVSGFNNLWGTDNPDLSAFNAHGGKILTWHGWADDLIAPQGTLDYWQRVVDLAGSEEKTDEFYRVFMAPGLGHCGNGPGPQIPVDSLVPLVEWVERGNAPETILFSGNGQSRYICKFPKELEYRGSGNVSDAASWQCV
ncbi:putative feruloyl esterase B [Rosellinia necatrix]|uniref:Carboxylic ester hydrolase n=1 Tax=Rosellinia necatrix TaxID=77044 RepID=A0A1W2TWE0_ROSNE|nr:putative feruloyl esterase B [Rosellinia necatrix]